jgi:signal transduction histidine kinase
MYEAYTGAHLFAGLDAHTVIGKVLYEPKEHTPSFAQPTPPAFVALVTNAIAKSRDYRYSRVEDFLRDLEACQDLWYTAPQLTQKLEQRVAERTQELQEVNRQLEAASRHKSEFLARMSHELRTPMNAIIGFTRLVMRRAQDTLPKRDHENLGKVLISAEHLLALINDILDLSKVEAGRMEVHAACFEVEPLIDLCLRTVEPLLKSERLRLVKEIEGSLPPLFTDQDKLKQILMNLLSNALKFTEVGTITVTARCRDEELVLSVADTGIGIPTEQLERVFEEFHQVDSSHTRQYSGTGLGLSISRHFAQLLGGDITLQSTVGAGSTFTVTVPLHYDATQSYKL